MLSTTGKTLEMIIKSVVCEHWLKKERAIREGWDHREGPIKPAVLFCFGIVASNARIQEIAECLGSKWPDGLWARNCGFWPTVDSPSCSWQHPHFKCSYLGNILSYWLSRRIAQRSCESLGPGGGGVGWRQLTCSQHSAFAHFIKGQRRENKVLSG